MFGFELAQSFMVRLFNNIIFKQFNRVNMKNLKLSFTRFILLFLSSNLYAASVTQKKIFSIMTGQPTSRYKYSQELHFLSQLQRRIENS